MAESDHDYSYKIYFKVGEKTRKIERQKISMSLPPLELTPIGTKKTKATTLHLDSTPIGKKNPDPKPLPRSMNLSNHKGIAHVPEKLESDPSSSDSSSEKSDFLDDESDDVQRTR